MIYIAKNKTANCEAKGKWKLHMKGKDNKYHINIIGSMILGRDR